MKFTANKIRLATPIPVSGIAIAFLAMALILPIAGCSEKSTSADTAKNGKSTDPVPVLVANAEARDMPVELPNIGNVEAYATVLVRSQITGQLVKVHFREGQDVKAGDLLFSIDSRPADGALRHAYADLKRDEAQLVGARLEFERVGKLIANSIASRDDYDKAEASFHALEATVMADQSAISNAALNVEFTAIRSVINGRTGNLLVKEGNIIKAPDDSLVTINQVHPIYVTFSVPESDLPQIRNRMQESSLIVEVDSPDGSPEPLRGELTFVDNTIDTTTGRIKLKATFPNFDNRLWPGQYVQTRLVIKTLPQAVVVPSQAIQSSQSGDFVFVVQANATVQKRPVTVGSARGPLVIVESGVKAGEVVVTDGQLRLTEGVKVSWPTQSTDQREAAAEPAKTGAHE